MSNFQFSSIDLSNPIQLSSSKWSAQLYHDHSGELRNIRKAQNVLDSHQSISHYRLSPTTSNRRHLARSASAQFNPPSPLPQPKGTDDSRIRPGPLSIAIHSPRRQPVVVDDDLTLSRISSLIRSTNSKQNDDLSPSGRENPRALSNTVSKQVQEDKPQWKFPETRVLSFEALSTAVNKKIQKDKAQEKVIEAGGPVIDIGQPRLESTPWYLRPQYADQLDIDNKGSVRTGSLLSLLERLTTDPGTSDTAGELALTLKPFMQVTLTELAELAQFKIFTNVFLMTFRTFTTADHLFDMLVERFHLKPEMSLTGHEYIDWKAHLRNPVQRLVLEIFSIWLEDYRLLEEEPHIVQRMRDFLTLNVYLPQKTTATTMIQTIDRLVRRAI